VTGRRGDKVTTPPATDSPAHPITPSPSHASDTSPLGLLSTEGSTQSPEFFRTVARLGIQAAEALEHAHQMGVVHRDIKPSNLMVESRLPSPSGKAAQSFFPSPSGRGAGGEGAEGERRAAECPHLWITDFGLAMTQTEMNLTMTGDVLGTLRYMSPEQVQAKHGVLDHRTDVYSLGLTLYELLTLQPAFPGDNRQKLLRQVIEDEPRPPRQLNTSIPKDLETIILKATAKEPQSRYATAQQLADDLRRFVEDRPIRARPPSLLARAAKWARRHRAAVTATIAAAFLVVLAGAGFFFYGQQREAALRREAQQQRDRAEKNLQLALRAVDRIYLKYARDNYLKVGGIAARRITPEVEEFLNEAMGFYEQFAQANRDNPSVRVETVRSWDRVARVRSRLGMHDQAQVASQQAIDIAEELLSEFPDELQYRDLLCRVHYNRGAAFVEGDRFDQAVSAYTEAIEINPKFSRAFHNRGSARAEKGDLDKVIDDYTEAIRLSPASSWYAYHARGRMYLKKRQFAQAIEDFNNALKRGPQGDDVYAELGRGQLLSDLAWLLATCPEVRLRDPDRAVRLAAEAVKLRPYWRQTFGVARYRAGDFKGSIEVLEKSTKDPCSWSFLAMAYWQLGEKQEARQWYDQAVERLATLAKTLEARDTKMRLAPGEDLGPEPFRRFVTEAAQLLGLEPPAAPAPETTEGGPQAFVGHMIFAWSAWEDPIW
jgi:tetratricopeptide (TPR) repeat protein